jgi:hypothetical protein
MDRPFDAIGCPRARGSIWRQIPLLQSKGRDNSLLARINSLLDRVGNSVTGADFRAWVSWALRGRGCEAWDLGWLQPVLCCIMWSEIQNPIPQSSNAPRQEHSPASRSSPKQKDSFSYAALAPPRRGQNLAPVAGSRLTALFQGMAARYKSNRRAPHPRRDRRRRARAMKRVHPDDRWNLYGTSDT